MINIYLWCSNMQKTQDRSTPIHFAMCFVELAFQKLMSLLALLGHLISAVLFFLYSLWFLELILADIDRCREGDETGPLASSKVQLHGSENLMASGLTSSGTTMYLRDEDFWSCTAYTTWTTELTSPSE